MRASSLCCFCLMIIMVIVLFLASGAVAEEVNIALAKSVIQAEIERITTQQMGAMRKPAVGPMLRQFSLVEEPRVFYDEAGDKLAYVQQIHPQGFIVVSADDEMEPVLGYSLTHDFVWDDDPENLLYHLVKADIPLRKKLLPYKTASEKSRIREKWGRLAAGIIEPAAGGQTVWPDPDKYETPTGGWVKTLWHQGDPFNASCPDEDVYGGRRCKVGCVATAMAQIINFHEYPTNVVDFSDADDYWSGWENEDISESFIVKIDDHYVIHRMPIWGQLNAALDRLVYPLPERVSSAVDELCYACGVSVEMQYSAESSGAHTEDVDEALRDKFGYVAAIWKNAEDDDFFDILKSNMQSAKPAEMAIRDISSTPRRGHAIVVDGFGEEGDGPEDDQYHLNYGWASGICFWWNLFRVDSDYPLDHGNFNYIAGAVVDISPPNRLVMWHPDGTVIQCGDRYLIENGRRRWIADSKEDGLMVE